MIQTGRIHAANPAKSARIKRVIAFLRTCGERGATTREVVRGADVCAVNTIKAEINHDGVERVSCTQEGRLFRYRLVKDWIPGNIETIQNPTSTRGENAPLFLTSKPNSENFHNSITEVH